MLNKSLLLRIRALRLQLARGSAFDRQSKKKNENHLNPAALFILAVIGASIFPLQFRHNKDVFAFDSTMPAVSNPISPSGIRPDKPLIVVPEGMIPATPPEMYNHQSLFELIDGQAELYLSAGFQSLKYQRFAKDEDPDFYIELFVYDMGNVQNAFAVFSMQRREDGRSLELAQFSYKMDSALFLVHGPYYLELIASLPMDEASQLMQSMAEDFIRNNKIEVKPIAELSLFPRLNLDEKSLSMIPSNAFGYDGLNQMFTGSYKLGDTSVTAFISHRESPIQAKKLALKYYEFLKEYGAEDLQPDIQIKGARLVRILDTYELIFTKGPYLAGIHEATDRKQAERLGELLAKRLKE